MSVCCGIADPPLEIWGAACGLLKGTRQNDVNWSASSWTLKFSPNGNCYHFLYFPENWTGVCLFARPLHSHRLRNPWRRDQYGICRQQFWHSCGRFSDDTKRLVHRFSVCLLKWCDDGP